MRCKTLVLGLIQMAYISLALFSGLIAPQALAANPMPTVDDGGVKGLGNILPFWLQTGSSTPVNILNLYAPSSGTPSVLVNGNLGVESTSGDIQISYLSPWGVFINTSSSYTGGWARELSFGYGGTKLGSFGAVGTSLGLGYLYLNANQAGNATGNTNPTMVLNTSGSVGIGTNSPQATLDVNGSVRPGNATAGAGCSPEGAFAYDMGVHSPIYCSNVGVWKTIGGGSNYTSNCVTIGAAAQGRWYSDGSRPMCPAGYVMTGIQTWGGCSGGVCGSNIVCCQ